MRPSVRILGVREAARQHQELIDKWKPPGPQVLFYEGKNFTGRSITFGEGVHSNPLKTIMSIQFPPSLVALEVELYTANCHSGWLQKSLSDLTVVDTPAAEFSLRTVSLEVSKPSLKVVFRSGAAPPRTLRAGSYSGSQLKEKNVHFNSVTSISYENGLAPPDDEYLNTRQPVPRPGALLPQILLQVEVFCGGRSFFPCLQSEWGYSLPTPNVVHPHGFDDSDPTFSLEIRECKINWHVILETIEVRRLHSKELAELQRPEEIRKNTAFFGSIPQDLWLFHTPLGKVDGSYMNVRFRIQVHKAHFPESYWPNCQFEFEMRFDRSYPEAMPTVTCRTRVYHPNIDNATGKVCISFLNNEKWASHKMTIYEMIQSMFTTWFQQPNGNDFLPDCRDIATELLGNPVSFRRNSQERAQTNKTFIPGSDEHRRH